MRIAQIDRPSVVTAGFPSVSPTVRNFSCLLLLVILLPLNACLSSPSDKNHSSPERGVLSTASRNGKSLGRDKHKTGNRNRSALAKFATKDGYPITPSTEKKAIKLAMSNVWVNLYWSFFCRCGFYPDLTFDMQECGYKSRSSSASKRKIRWVHIVPASAFGRHRACWKKGACSGKQGKDCCIVKDYEFRKMLADVHNIFPVIDELSIDRKEYSFGIVKSQKARHYGHCSFRVDNTNRIAQPAKYVRGDIARVYLYMHHIYRKNGRFGLPLTRSEITMFKAWHKSDPPDSWELDRNRRIVRIQRIGNPYCHKSHVRQQKKK